MSWFTENNIPESIEDVDLWLKEAEQDAHRKHQELDLKRVEIQLENQNENKSNKRESL
jgi:hypothetical protein